MFDPKDVIPQLEAMRLGVDYRVVAKVRGFSMVLRPLTISEDTQVAANVNDKFNQLPETAKNTVTQSLLYSKEVLIKASTSDVDKNDPKITEYLLDRMTHREIQSLWKDYCSAIDRADPSMEEMSQEDLKALVDGLKKNDSQLTELSTWELISVCRHLIKGD